MAYPRLTLKKGITHRCLSGHLWVYDSEVHSVTPKPEPGGIVDVFEPSGRFVGRGYHNEKSKIRVRLLTFQDEPVDRAFFARRLKDAWEFRQRHTAEHDYCRLVFGEGDFLPGLVVDKFGDVLVLQCMSLGIEARKSMIVDLLNDMLSPRGIYERSDQPVRQHEGLSMTKGFLSEEFNTHLELKENGYRFTADVAGGQKTGFFYDQRENRMTLASLVRDGGRVLDCFCYVGSFAIHAAALGATHVTAVDISEDAVAAAKSNAELNGVADRCEFVAANAFDSLRTWSDEKRSYDVVILDPPAFTKNRAGLEGALRGYKEINLRGLHLVRPGGYLVTCSCSHHVSRPAFMEMLVSAAHDAKRRIRLVHNRTQATDHPIIPAIPETEYLKFVVVQVM